MTYSSHDMLALVAELNERRMPMVFDAMSRHSFNIRLSGMANIGRVLDMMPDHVRKQYETVRNLHWRYKLGQYSHTEVEAGMLGAFASWLLEKHFDCKGQTPGKFQLNLSSMRRQTALPPKSYEAICQSLRDGNV